MMNIQKKSLEHVSEILDTYDSHNVYRGLNETISDMGIDNQSKLKILNKLQELIHVEYKKVRNAKEWIDILISDIK